MQSNAIELPSNSLVLQQDSILNDFQINDKDLKLVVYADSVACTSYTISHLGSWDRFLDYAKQFKNQLCFYFIFSPARKELRETRLIISNISFEYPILLDSLGEFEKLNPHLPKNHLLHTFLLDENNRVILVGNPLRIKFAT